MKSRRKDLPSVDDREVKKRPPIDYNEQRRLDSMRSCAQELSGRFVGDKEGFRPVCQMVRLWRVHPASRMVEESSSLLTYLTAINAKAVHFLLNRPKPDLYVAMELLDQAGKVQLRLLARTGDASPAIRGLYQVRASILTTIPVDPVGVIFNKGYFIE
jgi:hypothetical protein